MRDARQYIIRTSDGEIEVRLEMNEDGLMESFHLILGSEQRSLTLDQAGDLTVALWNLKARALGYLCPEKHVGEK